MIRRDFFVAASTAAICSLVAYLAGAATTTPSEVLRCASSAASGDPATALNKPGDKAVQVKAGKRGLDGAAASEQQGSSLRDSGNHANRSSAQDAAVAFQKRQELGERFSNLFNGNPESGVVAAIFENRF